MVRSEFIKSVVMAGMSVAGGWGAFKLFANDLPKRDQKMPVLFIGHGSPMNGIEQNSFSNNWKKLGESLPQPSAVVIVSAHWLTKGTQVLSMPHPKTIHDFGGFPKALYEVQYPAPGHPELAKEIQAMVKQTNVGLDHDWGLDHGAWTIARHIFPEANIPTIQLSIDYDKPAAYHYSLAAELAALRQKGVLIIGSGNIIHNLRMVAWDKLNEENYGYDWALELNEVFNQKILSREHQGLINYGDLHAQVKLAIPTPDHYYPLIYALGLSTDKDEIELFNNQLVGGSLNMTSVIYR